MDSCALKHINVKESRMQVRPTQSASLEPKSKAAQLHSVLLACLVVAATAVANHLDARERERDVRRGGCEELLARLRRQNRILAAQRRIADRAHCLPCNRAQCGRQAMLLGLARPLPRCKVTRLPARMQSLAVSRGRGMFLLQRCCLLKQCIQGGAVALYPPACCTLSDRNRGSAQRRGLHR